MRRLPQTLTQAVATDVLEALHVPPDDVDINAEMSDRYHEVGFLISFNGPSLGADEPLSIDTAPCDCDGSRRTGS